jgi:hypothetical protein
MASGSSELTYYQVLEVHVDAKPEEIKEAYLKIADHLSAQSLATYSIVDEHDVELLRSQLEKAYLTLIDPEERQRYNASLGLGWVAGVTPQKVSYISSAALPEEPQEDVRAHVLSNPKNDLSEVIHTGYEKPANAVPKGVQWAAQTQKRILNQIHPDTEFTGPILRQLREGCEATLDDVFRVTKVSVKYLHALEENDYQSLPSPAYVRGYVREYARFLGLDPSVVSHGYMRAMSRKMG